MDLPEPLKNIVLLYVTPEQFKFFDPSESIYKLRIDVDFLVEKSDRDYKEQYNYYDYMFNAKAKIVHLPRDVFVEMNNKSISEHVGFERSMWQETFPKRAYDLIKDLKKGDIIESEKVILIVNEDNLNVSSQLLDPYVSKPIHNFNPIFEFPLLYWQNIGISDFGRFNIRFPQVEFKVIDIKSGGLGYRITIFNHKGINYGITTLNMTHNHLIDNTNCSNNRYISTSVYPDTHNMVAKNSNLLQILKDNRVDPRMVLMKID